MEGEFKNEEKMVNIIKETVGEQDLLVSTANSVISHMTELAFTRDNTSDPEVKAKLEDALDMARVEMQNLILQMSGAIDHLRGVGGIPDDVFIGISDKIAEIEGNLTKAEGLVSNTQQAA
jgi:hypothetical protein